MITPQLNNRYGWYRIAWTALLVGMIPQFAIAGKLSDTSDVVGDDDDDDDSFCFFCFLFSGNSPADQDFEGDEDDSRPEVERDSRFLPYPYARGTAGYSITHEAVYDLVENPDTGAYSRQLISEKTTPKKMHLSDGKAVAVRALGAYRYDWDGVHLSEVRLGIDYASTVGMQMRWTEFMEPVDGGLDHLTLVDMMLRAPLVTAYQGMFHLGLGGLLMHYESNTRLGAYGAFQVRLFPLRPLVMGADVHIGYVNKAFYLRGEITVGVILGPAELFAAYDTQMFLGEHDSIFYHGPGVGLRFWF
ncbi:MAG: hypothetical protein JXX29_02925 [Deltaproteobacteria bacterium]|nr:hypothetical protein [Deltaproteobacteria bacterium]